ncbi:hypothetical protein IFM89_000150 [Coptis chinensis]|uniref:RNase H type-1 domain-containing protein n=1 Tax=Coptis chinensis TaxID=261450 RepID=A0A835H0N6_9MAGN|nr:hypothetical protein IFM89_000150 [Coptis chinensis]
MLNTDGFVQYGSNGYGGMNRDAMGNVILAYAGSSPKSLVIYQELQAIAEGRKQAIGVGITNLEVNLDSLGPINILNDLEQSP